MRNCISYLATSVLLTSLLSTLGCSRDSRDARPEHNAQLANPASEYCISQGGRLENRKDASGNEYSLCRFADGREIEEWALYRRAHP